MNKHEYNDSELLYLIHQKNESALRILIQKYDESIRYLIRDCRKKGGYTMDDYYQLAMMKLLFAVEGYRSDKNSSFAHFYTEIVRRTFIDHYRKCNSYNGYMDAFCVSFDSVICEESTNYTYIDQASMSYHHAYSTNDIDVTELIKECKRRLNKVERNILGLRLLGYTYHQIAEKMNINVKKVDNTVQKLRNRKTRKS